MWLATARLIPPVVCPNRRNGSATHSFGLLRDPKAVGAHDRQLARHDRLQPVDQLGADLPGPRPPPHAARKPPNTPGSFPSAGYFGALLGGAISWRLVRSGQTPVAARKRACLISAVLLLGTMAIPLLPNPALATAGMSLSFFWVCAWSTNHYTLPIDIYGAGRAAFGGASWSSPTA